MAAYNSPCASPITSRGMTSSASCRDSCLSDSSIVSSRQASGTPASPKRSLPLEEYPSSSSIYSLTSAPTSDSESPPETPARGRSSELNSSTPTLFLLSEPSFQFCIWVVFRIAFLSPTLTIGLTWRVGLHSATIAALRSWKMVDIRRSSYSLRGAGGRGSWR